MKHDAHRYTRRILIQRTCGVLVTDLWCAQSSIIPVPALTFWVIKFIGNFNLSKTRLKK